MNQSKNIADILEIVNQYEIDLNFGLSPNPFGFSFICYEKVPKRIISKLDRILLCLNDDEEKELRSTYFNYPKR